MGVAARAPTIAVTSLAALCACAPLLGQASGNRPAPRVVGIVLDGPWERNEELLPLFRSEILDLVGEDFGVTVPADRVLVGDWTADGVRAATDRLLADPGVDLVVGLGVLASQELAGRPDLPKPSFAPVIIDPDLQGLPDAGGRSGIPNLNYLALPLTFESDVRALHEIVDFDRIAVLFSGRVVEAIPALTASIPAAAADLGLEVDVVAVTSAGEALAAIPASAEAVYVAPLHAWAAGELDRLVAGLIDRRLPSFARLDEREVARGFLATRTTEGFFGRLARRLALNIQSVLLGQEPGDLRTDFESPERLTVNMATARAIGVYPPWKVMTEAVLLNERTQRVAQEWSLAAVAEAAPRANLDLAAREREVAAAAQDVSRSRSRLFPQLDVSTLGTVIDADRASASLGQQSQRMLSGSASLTQILFSEPVLADLSVQGALQQARELDRDALALDIALDGSIAYLNVLRAKTYERIRQENLRLTRTNLEDARLRVRIGSARPAEVLRWESEIAVDRQAVIAAAADRNLAEMELNRILHRPLEEAFATAETDLDDPELFFMRRLYPHIDDKWSFEVFRRFMAREALANAPELRAVDAAIAAGTRALASARRSFWVPNLALQAGVSDVFGRGGAGSSGIGGDSLPLPFSGIDDVSWNVSLQASLPLFEGGKRAAETRQAAEEVRRLELERGAIAERVEQRVRAALHRAGSSFANIDLSRLAADAARQNFDLVRDAYAEGAATILDVLDAQNAFLVAELAAANAVYDFLIDFTQVQRAVGGFVFTMTADEREAFFDALDRFMAENQP